MPRRIDVKNFSLKFIDIMIGIVLGLGFQWWANLTELWQFIAFIFAYVDIVDYWIDYGPLLKKFPPQREIDVFLDLAICFSLFLFIYSTQLLIVQFLLAFILLKVLDFFWFLSSKLEYRPTGFEKRYVDTWMIADALEVIILIFVIVFSSITNLLPLWELAIFIAVRVVVRIIASYRYEKIYLTN